MFSKFFIDRPIFAAVVAIVTVLLGAVAILRLPIAQYPNITPPTIYVTTSYPGASAAIVANTVGIPIEQQVNGVPGMLYMQSYSASDGTYTLVVTFQVGTDMDIAQTLVYQRVAIALAQLPPQVAAQGVTVKQQSTNVLLFANLISPTGVYDSLFLTNYGAINLQNELARVPGVAQVKVLGAGTYPCASGSTRRSCRPSRWYPTTSSRRSTRRTRKWRPGQTGHAAPAGRPAVPVHGQRAGPPGPARPVRGHHRQVGRRRRRPAGADPRHRPGRAGAPDLQRLRPPDRARRRPESRSTSCRPPTRSRWRSRSRRRWSSSRSPSPRGSTT